MLRSFVLWQVSTSLVITLVLANTLSGNLQNLMRRISMMMTSEATYSRNEVDDQETVGGTDDDVSAFY